MRYDHDVIVIGGGPAGSTFARYCAAAGMDVLVVDKRREIGVPVRCGEGLGTREVLAQGLELPKRCISAEINGARVVAPNGKEIIWRDNQTTGWVLERKMFDKWLCELAVDKGAKVHTYTRATDLIRENGKIAGVKLSHGGRDSYEVRAPLVVSAEGMESLIARAAGFKTVHSLYDVDTCYQYEMKPYDHQNLIELYFGNALAPRGYVWIFPKSDRKANVGIGIGGNYMNAKKGATGVDGADPKVFLEKFIASHPQLKDSSTLIDFGGVISVGAPMDEFVKDNFMIIGTAAKQVDPIHGGGIALAMETSALAAATVIDAHEKKDFSKAALMPYEAKWKATLGKKMAKRLMLRKVMEKLNDGDLDYIFNTITDRDLNDAMDGKFAGPVAKVVAGRPQLLKVLGVLLS
jgi:digeranylgeranylglycerophospholipid reductase